MNLLVPLVLLAALALWIGQLEREERRRAAERAERDAARQRHPVSHVRLVRRDR